MQKKESPCFSIAFFTFYFVKIHCKFIVTTFLHTLTSFSAPNHQKLMDANGDIGAPPAPGAENQQEEQLGPPLHIHCTHTTAVIINLLKSLPLISFLQRNREISAWKSGLKTEKRPRLDRN
jgi:hypothetical protein